MQAPRLAPLPGKSASHALARAKVNADQTCHRMARRPRESSTATQLSPGISTNGSSNSLGRDPGGQPARRHAYTFSAADGSRGDDARSFLIADIIAVASTR